MFFFLSLFTLARVFYCFTTQKKICYCFNCTVTVASIQSMFLNATTSSSTRPPFFGPFFAIQIGKCKFFAFLDFFSIFRNRKKIEKTGLFEIFSKFFQKNSKKSKFFNCEKVKRKSKSAKKIAFSDFYCKKRPKKGGRVEEEVVALRKIDCSSSELLKTCSFKTKSEVH